VPDHQRQQDRRVRHEPGKPNSATLISTTSTGWSHPTSTILRDGRHRQQKHYSRIALAFGNDIGSQTFVQPAIGAIAKLACRWSTMNA